MSVLDLVVSGVSEVAAGVREVVLVRADGGVLPAHPAGSHVVVECGGVRNAYSLTSPGARPREYRIAVLLRADGSGGSRFVHGLAPGDRVRVSSPRSAFGPVATARRHLLVAAGIGVTPLLAHARAAVRWGRDVRMLYVHRPGGGAYAGELEQLLSERLVRTTDRDVFGAHLDAALRGQPLGTHLYVCGPGAVLDRVVTDAAALGWPPQRVHLERFVPAELDPGRRFVVRLARAGRDVVVEPGVSLLDALRRADVAVPSMCRQGVCGECRVPVLAGQPLHRDEYLSAAERRAGRTVLCCVSRAETDTLELDV